MAKTRFSGPIKQGTVNDTFGPAIPAVNLDSGKGYDGKQRNVGTSLGYQSWYFDYSYLIYEASSLFATASVPATGIVDLTTGTNYDTVDSVGRTTQKKAGYYGASSISFTSVGNDSDKTFTVIGTTIDGIAKTETEVGATAGNTVSTTDRFHTVESITLTNTGTGAVSASAGNVTIGTADGNKVTWMCRSNFNAYPNAEIDCQGRTSTSPDVYFNQTRTGNLANNIVIPAGSRINRLETVVPLAFNFGTSCNTSFGSIFNSAGVQTWDIDYFTPASAGDIDTIGIYNSYSLMGALDTGQIKKHMSVGTTDTNSAGQSAYIDHVVGITFSRDGTVASAGEGLVQCTYAQATNFTN
jgi:hypothetical protein